VPRAGCGPRRHADKETGPTMGWCMGIGRPPKQDWIKKVMVRVLKEDILTTDINLLMHKKIQ
jgi:hypothetical protein